MMKIMIHAHTTFSHDGELTPQALADVASRRHFDAVLVSDHFESLSQDRFQDLVAQCKQVKNCLLVPGYERSWRGIHVLALGVDQWIDHGTLEIWASAVKEAGGMTVLAHPSRYKNRIPHDILAICDGVEVWNSKPGYDGALVPNPGGYSLLGTTRRALCGQDIHGLRHATRVAIELRKSCRTGQEIINCLKRGDYLMTNGILRFGQFLRGPTKEILKMFHGFRQRAVHVAVKMRTR